MKKTLLISGIACAMVSQVSGDILVQYLTAGSTDTLIPNFVNAAVSGDNLMSGSGLTQQTFSTFNSQGWDVASTTFEAAVAANDYWSWGFDVTAPGTTITLTTADFRLDRSSTGPEDVEIRATINGSSEVSLFTFNYAGGTSGVTFTDVDISALGSVSTGDSVEFVLAAFNSSAETGSFDLETVTFPGGSDSMVINGTVVPEPSTIAAILGLFALGFVVVRRRR
jgi:hypothetical protein